MEKVNLEKMIIYTLAYADNMVLMAEEKKEMRSMIKRFREYLEEKNLELITDKTKIMRFRKGREKKDRKIWKWKEKMIEKVKEF